MPEHSSPRDGPRDAAPRPGPRLEWKLLCFAVTESSQEHFLKRSLLDFLALLSSQTFLETKSFRFFWMSFFVWRDNIKSRRGKIFAHYHAGDVVLPFLKAQQNCWIITVWYCFCYLLLSRSDFETRRLVKHPSSPKIWIFQRNAIFRFSRTSRTVELLRSDLVCVTLSYQDLTLKLVGSSNIQVHRRSGKYFRANKCFISQEPAESLNYYGLILPSLTQIWLWNS